MKEVKVSLRLLGNDKPIATDTLKAEQLADIYDGKFSKFTKWINALTNFGERKAKMFVLVFGEAEINFKGGKLGTSAQKVILQKVVADNNYYFRPDLATEMTKNIVDSMPLTAQSFDFANTCDGIVSGKRSLSAVATVPQIELQPAKAENETAKEA